MPPLRESCGNSGPRSGREGSYYAEDALAQARRLAEIAAYTPSPADIPQGLRRQFTEKVSVDFVDVPDEVCRIIIDVLTLAHLLGGKRNFFRVPDPLTNRRLLMDGIMLARLRIVLEQLESLLSSLLPDEEVWIDGAPRRLPVEIRIRPVNRVMSDMDHFHVHVKQVFKEKLKGVPNVRRTIQRICDVSPLEASLVGELRERHRRYQDQSED